jgi:putative lipoprotein
MTKADQRRARLMIAILALSAAFAPASARAAERITGTLTLPARVALPPQAVVRVSLRDVSRADAPAPEIAALDLQPKHQPPLPFVLRYEKARIHPAHTYAVSARVLVDGRLAFITTRVYPVITRGAPRTVEMILEPVGGRD